MAEGDIFMFRVCGRFEAARTASETGANKIASLLDPGVALPRPKGVKPEDHLELAFEDLDDPGNPRSPTKGHVARLLAFGRRLRATDRVLIHCEGGMCRSTAAALLLVSQAMGPGRTQEAMDKVAEVRPEAMPNPLIVALGAELLGRPELPEIAEAAARRGFSRRMQRLDAESDRGRDF